MKKLIPLLLPLLALALNAKAQDTLEYIPKGIATIRFTEEAYQNLSIDTSNGQITTSIHRVDSLFSVFHVSGIKKLFPVKDESKLITGIYRSYVIHFSSAFEISDVLGVLNSFPDVIEHAVPDYLSYPDVCPDDPKYANNSCNNIKQWNLERINMPAAWDIEKGCPDIRIAVLDVGFRLNHEDLGAKFSTQFRRDVIDWDITQSTIQQHGTVCSEDYGTMDNNPSGYGNHGTQVAGIAAAITNNGKGIAGVGWDIEIVPVRCGYVHGYSKKTKKIGVVSWIAVVRGIHWVIDNMAARVINISSSWDFGNVSVPEFADAVAEAINKGIVVVASSGNDNSNAAKFPAAYPGVIAVGATRKYNNKRWGDSNYGSHLSLVAPGKNIVTTHFKLNLLTCSITNNKYDKVDGTSYAAPQVAGAAALILSRNPGLSPAQVKNILESTATEVPDMNNAVPHSEYGYGLLNVEDALNAVPAVPNNLNITNVTFPFGPFNIMNIIAANTITAGPNVNVNPPADITFRAGVRVHLKPGFHAKAGSKFHALIDPSIVACSTTGKTDGNSTGGSSDSIPVAQADIKPEKEEIDEETTPQNSSFKIYPNPSPGQFYIELPESQNALSSIYIFDMLGNVVGRIENATDKQFYIDISAYSTGLYFVKVIQGEKVYIKKLVHQ